MVTTVTEWQGGCHCGAVRFAVRVAVPELVECNCTMCRKKGYVHLMVAEADVTWLAGRDALTEYTFHTHTAKHWFCTRCGIHAIYRPRSHPDGYSINARCLDDAPWTTWPTRPFDGEHWEAAIATL